MAVSKGKTKNPLFEANMLLPINFWLSNYDSNGATNGLNKRIATS
jgi:hypothetical protein